MGIDVAHRNVVAEFLAQGRDELGRQQRMAAEIGEEVLVWADSFDAQLLGPDRCDAFLERRHLRVAFAAFDNERLRGHRQAASVDFTARQHREAFEHVEICRHHVGRQPVAQHANQPRAIERSSAIPEQDVGGKALQAGVLVNANGCGGDLGLLQKNSLDLRQLDTIAAQLDLAVDAAEKFEFAVFVPAHKIARLIQAKL